MKKRIFTLLLVAVLVVAMVIAGGCRRNEGGKGGTAEKGSDTILIGGAMSLTGIQAPIDAPALEGINIAIAEINA